MADNYGSNKQNKGLPEKLKCAADGKMEASSMFSNNMLKKRSFNPNAKITCRKHTAGVVSELLCSSCRRQKPLEAFSNAERKLGGSQRCRGCIEWIEHDESGYIPLPAPNSAREPGWETMVYEANQKGGITGGPYAGHYGDFGGDERGDFSTEAQADAFQADCAPWTSQSQAIIKAARSQGVVGPKPGDHGNVFLTANNLRAHNDSSRPYRASSRDDGSYHASSAPTDTASTTGTESTAHPGSARQFNAYGPDGQFQKRRAGPATPNTSVTSHSTTERRSAWAKPEGRKYAPALPRHMENENPAAAGNYAHDDDDSSDGC
ncbi:hypothetical protein Daus18300_010983 [Diaporthe australafricana]|uniref:Stc1 domain-containing protein n=1 Tax=Diaporthe australafricana TaxID=127596 RepID=A0ABR3W8M7_9PEZI